LRGRGEWEVKEKGCGRKKKENEDKKQMARLVHQAAYLSILSI
jgi:hypothetical protein